MSFRASEDSLARYPLLIMISDMGMLVVQSTDSRSEHMK